MPGRAASAARVPKTGLLEGGTDGPLVVRSGRSGSDFLFREWSGTTGVVPAAGGLPAAFVASSRPKHGAAFGTDNGSAEEAD